MSFYTGKKQGDDIENGDLRSFTPMIMNKDDDGHATHKDHNEGIYI